MLILKKGQPIPCFQYRSLYHDSYQTKGKLNVRQLPERGSEVHPPQSLLPSQMDYAMTAHMPLSHH